MTSAKMTDEERRQLMVKMDAELDEFIADKAEESKQRRDAQPSGSEKSIEELVEELKDHPAFMMDFDPSKPMSPAMEGLQQLKYESESAEGNADSYKDDGNNNFKMKKYRWAIDSYTQGIKEKTTNRELNAFLYTNRAAAHFRLGNYRSSVNDCIIARKFKPDHLKALLKGVQCYMELKKYGNAVLWCDACLLINPEDSNIIEERVRAEQLKRDQERDRRREATNERKQEAEEKKLIALIKEHGVKLDSLASLETHHPSGAKVKVGEDGHLQWPVMFLYPEFGQTDFIESFSEFSRFIDHLTGMFAPDLEPPPWDMERVYTPETIQIYFEDKDEKLHKVNINNTLYDILRHERYEVRGGIPGFILLSINSKFTPPFLLKYDK